MKTRILASFVCMILCSCTSQPATHSLTRREKQCLDRVQVLMFDQSFRAASQREMDIYDETRPLQKPHKEIALLTCEGAAREEIDMTKGIMEKARLLGADAIIVLNPTTGSDFQMGHGGSRAVFRAKAVVYQ